MGHGHSAPPGPGSRPSLPFREMGPCRPTAGKAYEITYVRLKFHTSRPESFAVYKRSRAGAPWEPYQYYSASCQKTYGRPEGQHLRPGQDERVAFCTSEFSDISPLSGGNVAFSTLEGRPSAYSFEDSPVLQVRGGLCCVRTFCGHPATDRWRRGPRSRTGEPPFLASRVGSRGTAATHLTPFLRGRGNRGLAWGRGFPGAPVSWWRGPDQSPDSWPVLLPEPCVAGLTSSLCGLMTPPPRVSPGAVTRVKWDL